MRHRRENAKHKNVVIARSILRMQSSEIIMYNAMHQTDSRMNDFRWVVDRQKIMKNREEIQHSPMPFIILDCCIFLHEMHLCVSAGVCMRYFQFRAPNWYCVRILFIALSWTIRVSSPFGVFAHELWRVSHPVAALAIIIHTLFVFILLTVSGIFYGCGTLVSTAVYLHSIQYL